MAKRKYGSDRGGAGVTRNTDSHMIHDDRSAPCNLPRNVIEKEWPSVANYMNYGEADLFMGVQKQMAADAAGMKREFKARKY